MVHEREMPARAYPEIVDRKNENRQWSTEPVVGKRAYDRQAPFPYGAADPGYDALYSESALRSFSGADIRCVVHVIGNGGVSRPVMIANLSTLSYSVHREKHPVVALGHSYPVGFSRGGRTIAGSMIFAMFDREVLWDIIQLYSFDIERNEGQDEYSSFSPMLDQLPPFDITITFANEYGDVANMAIYQVEIVDEGTVLSIDDIMVEKTCSFVARDMDMVRPYKDAPNFRALGKDTTVKRVTSRDVNAFLDTLRSRRNAIRGVEPMRMDDVYMHDIPYDYALFHDTAAHDRKYPAIAMGDDAIYTNIQGITWMGEAIPHQVDPVELYRFVANTDLYTRNPTISNLFLVHNTYEPGIIGEVESPPPKYTILKDLLVRRDELTLTR